MSSETQTKDLTADEIFAAPDAEVVPVDVPEWKGRVYVKTLTAAERDKFESLIRSKDGEFIPDGARAKLVAAAACKSDGTPLFTFAQVEAINRKSAAAIDRIATAAQNLNGLGAGAVADEKKD